MRSGYPILVYLFPEDQKQQTLAKYSHGLCTTHLSLNRVDARFRIVSFRHPTFPDFRLLQDKRCMFIYAYGFGRALGTRFHISGRQLRGTKLHGLANVQR